MSKQTASSGKHKYFEDQFDNEEVLFVFRRHPVVMRKGLIFGMLCWLIGPLYTVVKMQLTPDSLPSIPFFFGSIAVSIVLGCLVLLPWYISWYFSVFIVSDQRLIQITQKGLFNRSVIDMGLRQIQMVNYQVAGLQETLLGFGTITMQTMVGELVIHYVHHPAKIQKQLLQILRSEGIAVEQTEVSTTQSNEAYN